MEPQDCLCHPAGKRLHIADISCYPLWWADGLMMQSYTVYKGSGRPTAEKRACASQYSAHKTSIDMFILQQSGG